MLVEENSGSPAGKHVIHMAGMRAFPKLQLRFTLAIQVTAEVHK